jgi:hypothetical protein
LPELNSGVTNVGEKVRGADLGREFIGDRAMIGFAVGDAVAVAGGYTDPTLTGTKIG